MCLAKASASSEIGVSHAIAACQLEKRRFCSSAACVSHACARPLAYASNRPSSVERHSSSSASEGGAVAFGELRASKNLSRSSAAIRHSLPGLYAGNLPLFIHRRIVWSLTWSRSATSSMVLYCPWSAITLLVAGHQYLSVFDTSYYRGVEWFLSRTEQTAPRVRQHPGARTT